MVDYLKSIGISPAKQGNSLLYSPFRSERNLLSLNLALNQWYDSLGKAVTSSTLFWSNIKPTMFRKLFKSCR